MERLAVLDMGQVDADQQMPETNSQGICKEIKFLIYRYNDEA